MRDHEAMYPPSGGSGRESLKGKWRDIKEGLLITSLPLHAIPGLKFAALPFGGQV